MSKSEKFPMPKWLTDLQQRSWEPEILLSGIVLYGMFKVPELLDEFLNFFKLNIFGDSTDIDNLVAFFKMGIYWLILGLIMHLICRGIWIGMVGLSYTLDKGIQMDKLNYQTKFKEKVEGMPAYEKIVMRLEMISSTLFSISFMLFMSLIGGYMYFFILLIIPFFILYVGLDMGFEGVIFNLFTYYVYIVVGLGVVGLIDFISLGYFRRFKWIAKIYWPLYKLFGALTFSRFYRPIYYGVVTNFSKWGFFLFLIFFSFVSIVGASKIMDSYYPGDGYSRLSIWGRTRGFTLFTGHYEDQFGDKPSVQAHIPSDVISGNVLKLFVVANIQREDEILKHTPLDSLKKVYPDTVAAALEIFTVKNYYRVFIDEDSVEVDRWMFKYDFSAKQRGYAAYIDMSELKEGLHHLKVTGPQADRRLYAEIPFYREIVLPKSSVTGQKQEEETSTDFQPKPFGIRDN